MNGIVEIFENQRYSFGGWADSALLPSVVDPFAFATTDGLDGWHSIEQASSALLSTGWAWSQDSPWNPVVNPTNTDSAGWVYAVNFSFIEEGVAEKGSLHFVRRRKLQRQRIFNVLDVLDLNAIVDCYCDSEEVDRVALQLLKALSTASHHKHPHRVSFVQMNELKSEFAHLLFLEGRVLNVTHDTLISHSDQAGAPLLAHTYKSSPPVFSGIHSSSGNNDVTHEKHLKRSPWESILLKVEEFAVKDKSVWFPGMQAEDNIEALIHRTVDVADHHFTYPERIEFAKLLIRCHDMDFRFHCNRSPAARDPATENVSHKERICTPDNCIFAPYRCVNQDCPIVISRKWREKHDATCLNKSVVCQRNCGVGVMRKLMHVHMTTSCSLRPVQCPFHAIGCHADLVFAAVGDHLTQNVSNHLSLAVQQIQEQQRALLEQQTQIDTLRRQCEQQLQLADAVQNGMGTVHALIDASELKQRAAVDEAISKQDIISTRKVNDLGSTLHLELNKITHTVTDLQIQLKEIKMAINLKS